MLFFLSSQIEFETQIFTDGCTSSDRVSQFSRHGLTHYYNLGWIEARGISCLVVVQMRRTKSRASKAAIPILLEKVVLASPVLHWAMSAIDTYVSISPTSAFGSTCLLSLCELGSFFSVSCKDSLSTKRLLSPHISE